MFRNVTAHKGTVDIGESRRGPAKPSDRGCA
jgi:hypothetical protein